MKRFAVRFFLLSAASLFLLGCGDPSQKLEQSRILALVVSSRAYATDHGGVYPAELADLHPKYIDLVSSFYSPAPSRAANSRASGKPYYYRPGMKVGSKVDEPLVVSPNVVKGKVNVGYLGGFIRQLDLEKAQEILSQPGWVQKAPELAGK